MFKKILIGLAAVAIACVLVRSGYEFGKYLAHKDKATQTTAVDSGQGWIRRAGSGLPFVWSETA